MLDGCSKCGQRLWRGADPDQQDDAEQADSFESETMRLLETLDRVSVSIGLFALRLTRDLRRIHPACATAGQGWRTALCGKKSVEVFRKAAQASPAPEGQQIFQANASAQRCPFWG